MQTGFMKIRTTIYYGIPLKDNSPKNIILIHVYDLKLVLDCIWELWTYLPVNFYNYVNDYNRTWTELHLQTKNGFSPKWNRNSVNSGNLINHWSMNWAQFKDPVSHMCLAGTVAASWSLTQEVAGWQVRALSMYSNDIYFVAEISEFSENI